MNLPQVRGTLLTTRGGRAVVTVPCLECGAVHRYDEGPLAEPEVADRLGRGFVDEWMPCRADLPGNFYRVVLPRPAPLRDAASARHAPRSNDDPPRRTRGRRRGRRASPAGVAG